MQYFIAFLEGIITFISPCLLPMLPIYISYFAGGDSESSRMKTLRNTFGFIIGFTLVFVALGAFAGTVGSFLTEYQTIINIIAGAVVVVFGLSYLGLIRINLFKGISKSFDKNTASFFSALLFGMIFSIGWTPCVGAYLGSALAMASIQGSLLAGVFMLLAYSMGLGIPFIASALLIDRLKGTFDFIKRHYSVINTVSGILLIVMGVLIMTGTMGYLMNFLSFGF